jgi:hypothetical protein
MYSRQYLDDNATVQRCRVRSPDAVLGSVKGEFSGRLICDAIAMQFRIRSDMRNATIFVRSGHAGRGHTEGAVAELYSADANRHICGAVMLLWSVFRSNVRIKARRGSCGSAI